MRQQVAEYLLIGRSMRGDREVPGMDRLRSRISAALGDELLPEVEEKKVVGSKLMTPASGIAVAASVAVVALVGLGQLNGPVDSGLQDAVAIDLAPAYTEPTVEQAMQNSPSERELNYLRRHGDSSPELGSSDILYRMATFELSDNLEVIEPQGRLVNGDEQVDDDAEETNTEETATNP
jgi:hypothetical protein